MATDVLIVGGGLAGLCCARALCAAGAAVTVLEASDGVGGRVRSDRVDGFVLDRGFQVLLTAYPEARAVLDYAALDLQAFDPGARVRVPGGFATLGDPLRRPGELWATLKADVGSMGDKLRILRLRQRALTGGPLSAFERPDRSTLDELRALGFSGRMIERFFRPFLGGVFFDRDLVTSSRMLYFTWRMFAAGDVAVPAGGMGQITAQIAAGLPEGAVRLESPVESVRADGVTLAGGETLSADAVVVATDGAVAGELLGVSTPAGVSTTTVYYATPEPPDTGPRLVLDGVSEGPVNNLCVMSAVAPAYAPAGQGLVSVSVVGPTDHDTLDGRIRKQMRGWFGGTVDGWSHLATYDIPYALPAQPVGALEPPQRPARMRSGIYVAGDHRDDASIQGAMVSGRRVAEAILADQTG